MRWKPSLLGLESHRQSSAEGSSSTHSVRVPALYCRMMMTGSKKELCSMMWRENSAKASQSERPCFAAFASFRKSSAQVPIRPFGAQPYAALGLRSRAENDQTRFFSSPCSFSRASFPLINLELRVSLCLQPSRSIPFISQLFRNHTWAPKLKFYIDLSVSD